ncbi:hypothetical protein KB20921_04000 [Edwardsiella ictaluri]|nr:hypothetical protein KH20906_03990 [Edwardsiella ictaluri]BEI01139.1 hypothetical protein KB20921_04000 [Edwardsiella ictaluri]BEI04611.1 hypothetical protein KH201010_03970 [Edwardsiella ictaluri]BEI08068.1 hypothetical protein STU22726_03990 [Edwardsiella ictaluri]BEI11549.1 hypothetical protein STU22816_04020 [Edwardsiella ictaluri]
MDLAQRAVDRFYRYRRCIAFHRITQPRQQRFRLQILQTGLIKLLTDLEANTITCLRFYTVKSRGRHDVSFSH